MSQVRVDASGVQAQDSPARGVSRPRPLSPHLQVWRWHVTMAASIATRVAGFALFAGFLIGTAGAVCLATGPGAYAGFLAVMGSVFGKLVLFGLTAAAFYYIAAGVRHLTWDTGRGFQPRVASTSALLAFVFGFVMALLVWAVAFAIGAA